MSVLLLLAGMALLVLGAELLVRGGSRLARRLRVPPLIVGLSVVAFGTSTPELAVSTSGALSGQASIALGNVVGSNIFNVLLILGVSALVLPLRVSEGLVRRDVPVMVGLSLFVLVLARDGTIGRVEGLFLLAGLVGYIAYLFRVGRSDAGSVEVPGQGEAGAGRLAVDLALIATGLVLLVMGSGWFVDAAVEIAATLGVSELVVGLTVVAAGTSLPELATSVLAAVRGERDIAVGNVIGSNIFNILAILGVAATVAPDGLAAAPAAIGFDLPVMAGVALLCLPVFFSGGIIDRLEGAVFVGFYAAYVAHLIMDATGHEALEEFRLAMLYVVLMTGLVLTRAAFRSVRAR